MRRSRSSSKPLRDSRDSIRALSLALAAPRLRGGAAPVGGAGLSPSRVGPGVVVVVWVIH